MSTLVTDPIDHWVDLDIHPVRQALQQECFDAFTTATRLDGPARAYWVGVGTGYAAGFGWLTREAVDRAQRTPHAQIVNPLEDTHLSVDEDVAWACGVLYGYKQGTSERSDAEECADCAQRLLLDSDNYASCHHGVFCEDHILSWHRPLRGWGADVCTFVDGLAS